MTQLIKKRKEVFVQEKVDVTVLRDASKEKTCCHLGFMLSTVADVETENIQKCCATCGRFSGQTKSQKTWGECVDLVETGHIQHCIAEIIGPLLREKSLCITTRVGFRDFRVS